ncbi:MAG: BMP family ABC transporter substrate-binding protein, partial [Anaerolineae bacterium]
MRYLRPLALTLVIGLLAACAPQGTFEVGMVTDLGPINARSFNETTWNGLVRAQEELPVAADYRTSIDETDHAPNIEAFLEQETDMIVTVGFLLGDTTLAYARENPDVQFAIVDFAYDVAIPENLLSITFQTDEAAFLAGYLAAGMTQTGTVGTFGGLNIPTVTIFMDGFTAG